MDEQGVLAWVESPLQLIGAAEWGASHARRVPVAGRLTAQMPRTADELLARGAWFGELEPYLGIPWKLLSRHPHWLVGDGFSGQFRIAASILRPKRVTFLDDGANTLALADALLGAEPFARPGVVERAPSTWLAPFAAEKVLARARAGRADFFTAFDLGPERSAALRDRGFALHGHSFEWTRESAPESTALGRRIVLGSARPVDGRMPRADYLDWVRGVAAHGAATYLPHRREPADLVGDVAAIEGIDVVRTGLPVELVLAGARGAVEIHTLPSSTTTTLRLVLEGTDAVFAADGRGGIGARR